MTISVKGLALLVKHETFCSHLYNDMSGCSPKAKTTPLGNCTVGYGTKVHGGVCDGQASEEPYLKGISDSDALNLRSSALQDARRAIVHNVVDFALNQNQFDALSVFIYNCGSGHAAHSPLYALLNAGKTADAVGEMKKFIYVTVKDKNGTKKKVLSRELVRRRKEEGDLFLTADDGKVLP
jgi:GH24 family phage-related lysozyme (muramidase)